MWVITSNCRYKLGTNNQNDKYNKQVTIQQLQQLVPRNYKFIVNEKTKMLTCFLGSP